MAFETELGNIATQTDVISDAISEALVQAVVAAPLIFTEDLPQGTNVKLWRKNGSLTAEAVAESAAYTFSASSELTQTTVTSTATKTAVASKLTVEAQRFSPMTPGMIAQEQGAALMRLVDDDILALFSGFSNDVTATSTLTVPDMLEGVFTVRSGTAGVSKLPLVSILEYKQVNELIKDIEAKSADVYSQPMMATLLEGVSGANGFRGTLPGVAIYETDGITDDAADYEGLLYDPNLAIAGMMSNQVETRVEFEGSAGGYDEIYSWIFSDFVEWNDSAGVQIKSDL